MPPPLLFSDCRASGTSESKRLVQTPLVAAESCGAHLQQGRARRTSIHPPNHEPLFTGVAAGCCAAVTAPDATPFGGLSVIQGLRKE